MKIRKITAISLGALVLAGGISFVALAALERDKGRNERGHTLDKQRPSTEVSSVFFPVSEIRKGAYVHVDVINNAMSGTDGHKIAGIIKSLSPEDQKNITVSMKISPETSSEDREVFEKYGTMSEDNTIKMYGDDFVGLANEEIVPKALGFIEARGKGISDLKLYPSLSNVKKNDLKTIR